MDLNLTYLTITAGVVYGLVAVALFNMAKSRGFAPVTRWILAFLGLVPVVNLISLIIVFFIRKT